MDEIGYLIKRAQHALRLRIDKTLSEHELTLPQYVALLHADKEPGISNAALARRAFVTPQTMYRVVRGLEERSLIERQSHPESERVQRLFLTQSGKNLLSQAHGLVEQIESGSLAHMDKGEIEAFRALLHKYLNSIHDLS